MGRRTLWPWGGPECECPDCADARAGGRVARTVWVRLIVDHWTDREIVDLHAAALAAML